MKKRMIVTVVTVSLAALLFAGCSAKKEDPAVKPDESQTTQTPETKPETLPETPAEPPTEPPKDAEATDGQIGKLVGLMGKTDEDVIAALGEGTASTDDAKAVTARDVETKLFDKAVTVSAAFDAGKVSMIAVYASEGDMAFWTEQATAELGDPTDSGADSVEGGDSKSLSWTLDGGTMVALREAYGAVSLEIFMGA